MKTLLKNGTVLNVFTDTLEKANVLIEDEIIVGVGDYDDTEADSVVDVTGKYVCPGLIDGHIHIESTMLTPAELARVCLPHGTTSIMADPHEIANVCGSYGIAYMLEMSHNIPLHVNILLPSCVPATPFDESGAVLNAESLSTFYHHKRVLGLAEMMNYPGVIFGDPSVIAKLKQCREEGRHIDGHAPLLSGKDLDKYISNGIYTDHETTSADEAKERISKGQWVMVREGTAAKNLKDLLPLFEEPWCRRAILCADDRHPADIINEGHIDHIIRLAVKSGIDPVVAIRMATHQAALCFGLNNIGAIAPGYNADILVLDDLNTMAVRDVYSNGALAVKDGVTLPIVDPIPDLQRNKAVRFSFNMPKLKKVSFMIPEIGKKNCRVIDVLPGSIITKELIEEIDFDNGKNGIDVDRDILKLAVCERHQGTRHNGVGYIHGIGLKKGAIASSISHDSHNLIVIGTNDEDMINVANYIRKISGGLAVCVDGEIVASMPLPLAGLMTDKPAAVIADQNEKLRQTVKEIGVNEGIEPFMNMAFVSLPVIPSLKMSTQGLVDVDKFERVDLVVGE
ncbi:MAG: adenine deaminase [Clostridia bacterium]|nr:adenine deaminase [Clostridia bacterium]